MHKHNHLVGKLVVISGPSGVGKSTICKEVVKDLDGAVISVSVTTRPKDDNEVEGRDYYFVTKEQFQEKIHAGQLLEYAEVFGNLYGTPKEEVDQALEEGKTVILEIDVQGGREVKTIYPSAVMIFILPPSPKHLSRRMQGRGRDDEQAAIQRLNGAGTEIAAAWQYYEHMVINDVLEQAVNEVIHVIKKVANN